MKQSNFNNKKITREKTVSELDKVLRSLVINIKQECRDCGDIKNTSRECSHVCQETDNDIWVVY